MLYFKVSMFWESDLCISCVFGFMLCQKHQENTNKLTIDKAKDKLSYKMVFGKSASVV